MKHKAKNFIATILGWQVRRLRKKNNFIVIGITGSIGKTSTKFAIASVLGETKKVLYQEGNYNDIVSVPLVFFGKTMPNIFNPLAWLSIFMANERVIAAKYPYDIVIAEIGTDGPGQIKDFGKYLQIDIAIVTAITPEHMEYFADLDAVAEEELSIANFARQLWVNKDLVDAKYLANLKDFKTYSLKSGADVQLTNIVFKGTEASFDILAANELWMSSNHQKITEPQLYSLCAAAAIANQLNVPAQSVDAGIKQMQAVSGRMQQLQGLRGSVIIDDTYNASPEAVIAALDTLYRLDAPQKIAVLGNMNELGKFSEAEHKRVGNYCDPEQIDFVITIGPDANKFLAPTAEARGCQVRSFDDPYSAGEFVKDIIKDKALILVKGSQNKVFAEETVKVLLANPADKAKLVRQSPYWLSVKKKNFS